MARTTNKKIYIDTDKGIKQGIKIDKDRFVFADDIKTLKNPSNIGGVLVCGTVKIQAIPPKKETVKKQPLKNTGYFAPYLVPSDTTFTLQGDFKKSSNEVSKEIKSIKRPKKRKAGQNLKQENVLDTVFRQGFLYGNALQSVPKKSAETKNKRAKNRK